MIYFTHSLIYTVVDLYQIALQLTIFETLVSFNLKAFFLLNRYPIMKILL